MTFISGDKYETLDLADVKVILEGGSLDKPTVTDLLAAERERTQEKAETVETVEDAEEATEQDQD